MGCVAGRHIPRQGCGEQNTHLHTLAFQMATPLMQDCLAQGGFWGTRRPGHSQGPPAPNSLFPRGPQARAACLRQKGHREDKGLCLRGRSGRPCSLWPDASAGAFVKTAPLPASEGPRHPVPAPSRVTLAESSAWLQAGPARGRAPIRVRAGGRPQPRHPLCTQAVPPSRGRPSAWTLQGTSVSPVPGSGGPFRLPC